MSRFLLALLIIATPIAALAEDPAALLDEGLARFKEANNRVREDPAGAREAYAEAAALFERVIQEGDAHNGAIYYNLGNAYYLANDIGPAILNYRRAEVYSPEDPLLKENLAEARRQRRDVVVAPVSKPMFRTLFFWHHDFSLHTRAGLFLLFYIALCGFAFLRLYRPRTELRWAITACALLSFMFAASVLHETGMRAGEREGVILASEIMPRTGDSAAREAALAVPLHAGTEFKVIQTSGDWYGIELPDRRSGWVPATAVALLGEE